jgi:hypothetical protein
MQAKHKNTGRWEGTKPCLSDSQVHLAAKKCGPGAKDGEQVAHGVFGPTIQRRPSKKTPGIGFFVRTATQLRAVKRKTSRAAPLHWVNPIGRCIKGTILGCIE